MAAAHDGIVYQEDPDGNYPDANAPLRNPRPQGIITLTRPEVMNALNSEIVHAIGEAIREFGNDKNLLVAIITGEGGRAFSAGMDLKETSQRDQGSHGRRDRPPGWSKGRLR